MWRFLFTFLFQLVSYMYFWKNFQVLHLKEAIICLRTYTIGSENGASYLFVEEKIEIMTSTWKWENSLTVRILHAPCGKETSLVQFCFSSKKPILSTLRGSLYLIPRKRILFEIQYSFYFMFLNYNHWLSLPGLAYRELRFSPNLGHRLFYEILVTFLHCNLKKNNPKIITHRPPQQKQSIYQITKSFYYLEILGRMMLI